MVIDTESKPFGKNEKQFYGITKDGKEFFTDDYGNKNYHSSFLPRIIMEEFMANHIS